MSHRIARVLYTVTFAFGLVLVWFGYRSLAGITDAMTAAQKLTIAVLYLNYIVLFCDLPLVFSPSHTFDQRIPGLGISLFSQVLFHLTSLSLVFAGAALALPFTILLVGEGVVLFLLLLQISSGYFAGAHVSSVQNRERNVLAELQRSKSETDKLYRMMRAEPRFAEIANALSKGIEAYRYASPVASQSAHDLEARISESAIEICERMRESSDDAKWQSSINDIVIMARQLANDLSERKNLSN